MCSQAGMVRRGCLGSLSIFRYALLLEEQQRNAKNLLNMSKGLKLLRCPGSLLQVGQEAVGGLGRR